MKKLLLLCFLAIGIGMSAQYNYTSTDPFNDPARIFFAATPSNVTGACGTSNGISQATTALTTQIGVAIQLDKLAVPQTNNGQAATISLNFKKSGTGSGTLYLVLFDAPHGDTTWNINTIAQVAITSATVTTCTSLTGTIPAGVMKTDGATDYAYGYFYAATSGNATFTTTDYKIVQDAATDVPLCSTFISPLDGSTLNYGAHNFKWNATPKAVGYQLSVGTTPGGNDVFNNTIVGGLTNQYVPLSPNKTYYAKLVPYNLVGNATGCQEISFSTNNVLGYCDATSPTYTNTAYEIISSVVFADINNVTPTVANTPGYLDYTSVTAHVKKQLTYPITVNIKGFDSAGPDKTSVWIDYNHDGIFADNEKTVLSNAAAATGNITIPASALNGPTRMRISMTYSADPVSCGNNAYGQVQDYTVDIQDLVLPSCTAITSPADGATNVTAASTILNWNKDDNASGYKVYVGTASNNYNVVNGTIATTNSFNLNGLALNTTYFVKVVPTNPIGDATGCSEISFTTGANWTYCAATHSTVNADRMSNVTFADINNPSTVATIPNGYEDFTAVVGNVTQGQSYPMTITLASANTNDKVSVWIDLNNNGVFDASERFDLTGSGTGPRTGTIAIPADATIGNTRMRVRMSRQNSIASIVACGNISAQGRTHDYTLNIIDKTLAASNANKDAVSVYPNPFTDILRISDVKNVKSITISDVSGRQVKTLAPAAELNLSSLNAGLYLVTLHMNDGSVKTVKAIKQ
ncbi:GEVED domain-containing protein [Chryseobacterium koreense]